MDHPSETSLCIEGTAVHRLSGTDNPSSNCPSKLADKVRRIAHSKYLNISKTLGRSFIHPRVKKEKKILVEESPKKPKLDSIPQKM